MLEHLRGKATINGVILKWHVLTDLAVRMSALGTLDLALAAQLTLDISHPIKANSGNLMLQFKSIFRGRISKSATILARDKESDN